MLTTLTASLALGFLAQIPPPGGGGFKVPPLKVGPAKTYLVAPGKPILEIPVPYPAGPLAMPAGPITFRMNLDANVVRWLQADNARVFDGTLIQVDATGKTLNAYDIRRTAIAAIGFQALSRVSGGSAIVAITLTPGSATINKTATVPISTAMSEPRMRILGYDLSFANKPAPYVDRILPFMVTLGGTEFRTDWTVEMSVNTPPSYGPATGCRLSLRLQALSRPEVRLNLDFKVSSFTGSGPRRANIRIGSLGFN